MRPALKVATVCLFAVIGPLPALASAGLSCEASDKALELSVESGVTRGMGGPFFDFKATLALKLKDVPDDLRKLDFADAHLPHHWLGDKEVRLRLYREREGTDLPHASVEIEILTRLVPKSDGEYRGTYALTVDQGPTAALPDGRTMKARGRVACSAG